MSTVTGVFTKCITPHLSIPKNQKPGDQGKKTWRFINSVKKN